MRLKKTFAVLSVLFLSLLGMGQYHDTKHGTRSGQSSFEGAGGGASSIYDSATAVWTFNDPTDLGADNGDGTFDLTPGNTPTATGGALGYSTSFNGTDQYAYIADGASFNHGGTKSWGVCGWSRQMSSPTTGDRPYTKYNPTVGGDHAEFLGYWAGATTFRFISYGGSNPQVDATVTTPTLRHLYCFWYNASDKKPYVSVDGAAPTAGTANTGTPNDSSTDLAFGAQADPTNFTDVEMGPVAYFLDGIPPYSDLYNGGKGYTCQAASDAGFLTNATACWDMDENGGPYSDGISVGTIQKLSGANAWDTDGAISQSFSGAGYYEFEVTAYTVWTGLRQTQTLERASEDFSLYFPASGTVYVYELLSQKDSSQTWTPGDTFKIAVSSSGVVTYSKNGGAPFYTSSTTAASTLYASVQTYNVGAKISSANINGSDVSWDMATSATAVGTNPLTPVSSPTRGAGLVEQSESGMGMNLVGPTVGDYLSSTDDGLVPGSGSYGMSGWVYTITDAGTKTFVYTNNAAKGVYAFHSATNMSCRGYKEGGSETVTASAALSYNVWHFVSCRYDSTTQKMYVYVDGSETASSGTLTLLNGTTDTFTVSDDTAAVGWSGVFDDVAIWPGISKTNLDSIYASGAGLFYTAYWDAFFSGDPIRFAWSQRPEIRRMN